MDLPVDIQRSAFSPVCYLHCAFMSWFEVPYCPVVGRMIHDILDERKFRGVSVNDFSMMILLRNVPRSHSSVMITSRCLMRTAQSRYSHPGCAKTFTMHHFYILHH